MSPRSRRRFLALSGVAVAGSVGGCGSGATDTPTSDADVVVGPNGTNAFDPETLTVEPGETVTWEFVSAGHNVSAVPDHAPQVSLPEGADPFASYGTDGTGNETHSRGETFEHTFETSGEYTYVCVPHLRQGMVGTVVVEA